jgi:hypothetical protein
MLHPPEYPLQGFGGKPIKPVGKVLFLYLSEILTMPEQKLSLLMQLTSITHISRFTEVS